MLKPITIQQLTDASEDAFSLGEFINGDDEKQVVTRLNETYPSIKKAVKTIFENGGLPATPFATKALMTASALTDDKYAMVTDDTVAANNGLYLKRVGAWVKAAYDPLSQAKVYTDASVARIATASLGKNLYDKNSKVIGRYLNPTAGIAVDAAWSVSPYIPVVAGQTYTISATTRRVGTAFFADTSDTPMPDTYESATGVVTRTVPTGAKYLVINIDSNTITASNVQVEFGSVATDYAEYSEIISIKKELLPTDLVDSTELKSAIATVDTAKPYEVAITSVNLFDKNAIKKDQYLSNTGKIAINSTSLGWATSDYIPVVAGQTYTLSGTRGRAGISFFGSMDGSQSPILYDSTSTLPLTVTAPNGAKYVIFNVYSATSPAYNNLQFEQGDVASSYTPYAKFLGIDTKFLVGSSSEVKPEPKSVFNIFDGGNASIAIKNNINLTLNLILTKTLSYDTSSVFNFNGDDIDGARVRPSGDDVAPIRMDGTTIGANHGYMKTAITMMAHGKTSADVGSIWSDSTNEFVLIAVPTVDKLLVTARESNLGLTANTLTHVLGAINTSAINSTNKENSQWYPAIKNHSLNAYVDGAKIDINAAYEHPYSKNVAFHESYEIMAKKDIVEWIIANKGVSHKSYNAVASVLFNNSYVFDVEGGCTIYTSLTAYKTIPFSDYMGTQSGTIADAVNRKYYVPKSIPFIQDAVSYDFSSLQVLSTNPTNSLLFNAAKNESGANPIDRLIQFNGNVGFAIGYLPLLDAEPTKRLVNASNLYIEVRGSSLKVYPRLVDGLKTTLAAGDSFAGIAYRKYFKRSATRTTKYVVRSNVADFLYLDWHSAKTDVIELPDDLIGRSFTVHEKSSNVTLLSAFATNNIAVKVDSSKSYGYLVLRFDK